MKTILVFVVALVLGALLVYFLGPRISRPVEEPPKSPVPDVKVNGEEKALHLADVYVKRDGDECVVETYPPVLCGRVGEAFVWKIVTEDGCTDYLADLQIKAKNSAHEDDLVIDDVTTPKTKRRGTVRQYPAECDPKAPPCPIPYAVVVKSTATGRADLREDPNIDIWK
jgi:hypothetical protein